MRTAYTSDQIRSAELALMARLPEGTLMDRAAAGLAAMCAHLLTGSCGKVYGSRVVLLIGSGDNGGDALYAGARLARRGARVEAVLAGSRTHEGGLAALREAGGRAHPYGPARARDLLADADLVVDGLVGIGGSGALREPYGTLAELTAETGGLVVAVDVPSGVDASSGRVEGPAVRAHLTVTFGAYKSGLLVDPGAAHAGVVELVDIGLGPFLPDPEVAALTADDVADLLPRPGVESDKYRRGVVGIAAGSDRYAGAAVLAVGGAVRAGVGMVRFAGSAEPVRMVRTRWPEAVTTVLDPALVPHGSLDEVGRVQAWVLGPGLGTGPEAHAVARAVLSTGVPVLVDADGLTLVAKDRTLLRRTAPTVLTPHAGELSRLLGVPRERIEARRLEHVRRAAAELGATVLLKGSTTLVAEEDRPVRVNTTGTPWLATGGTGDVLSGIAGALLAAGLTGYDAASCAAYVHGLAARVAAGGGVAAGPGQAPIAAMDVAEALPEALRTL
ncbi:bifunctional NAD(P)H-hydrate repair enzyme [Microbispora rosea subsp. aerata]|nr:NAD(P)H-hydrate dehydratase [Microbispora rosea]GGO06556.1 bifunctional NAD(P)H-hydrate repair enzyme [Microbispora rosea subsp. aerata]GIH55104.1 bifunctional NAD(P)H-hydrate repair enzyme [Microbispora rosea subsp. aerata]GLJ82553.1 bifunctional NAD(P)H-hydrate repair enzyme [Microbispora rosea subsp. aerata]